MAPFKKLAVMISMLALLISACGVGARTSGKAARQESGAAASRTPTPANAGTPDDDLTTLRIHHLRLRVASEKGGNRVRLMVTNAGPQLRVTILGNIDQEERSVTVCPVTDQTSLPPSTQCVLPVAGRPVDFPSEGGVRGAEITLAGRSSLVDLDEIALTYTAGDRRVKVLLPNLDPPGDDPGCLARGCPSLQMTPARDGKLSALLSWSEPGGALLDIRTAVAAPAAGASPTPPVYRVISSSSSASNSGPGSVSVASTISSEQEALLAVTNNGTGPLITPVLDVTWP